MPLLKLNNRLGNKGVSLIELVIASSVLIVGIGITSQYFADTIRFTKVLENKSENKNFVYYSSKLVKLRFERLKHRFLDPDQVITISKHKIEDAKDLEVAGLTSMVGHEKTWVYENSTSKYYASSSVLGSVDLNKSGLSITRGKAELIYSRCLSKSWLKVNSGGSSVSFFKNIASQKKFPVGFKSIDGSLTVKCCQNTKGQFSCTDAEKENQVPYIVWFNFNSPSDVNHRIYPGENDSSLGVGFFYYLDKSSGLKSQLKIDYFSIYDPCKSSTGLCDQDLLSTKNLSKFPTYNTAWFENLSYPIQSAKSFIVK